MPSREFSEHPNATSHLPGSMSPQLLLCLPWDVTPPCASNHRGELTAPSGASALCWWSLLRAPLWPPLGHFSNVQSALPILPKASQGPNGHSQPNSTKCSSWDRRKGLNKEQLRTSKAHVVCAELPAWTHPQFQTHLVGSQPTSKHTCQLPDCYIWRPRKK